MTFDLPQFILFVGVTILLASTYTTLYSNQDNQAVDPKVKIAPPPDVKPAPVGDVKPVEAVNKMANEKDKVAAKGGQLKEYTIIILTYWGLNKMAKILRMTLSNAFSWHCLKLEKKILLKFVFEFVIDNKSALVQDQTVAWQQASAKATVWWPSSTMPCRVAMLQWVNELIKSLNMGANNLISLHINWLIGTYR